MKLNTLGQALLYIVGFAGLERTTCHGLVLAPGRHLSLPNLCRLLVFGASHGRRRLLLNLLAVVGLLFLRGGYKILPLVVLVNTNVLAPS